MKFMKQITLFFILLFHFGINPTHVLSENSSLITAPALAPKITMPPAHPLRVARQKAVVVHMEALQGGRAEQVQLTLFNDTVLTAQHTIIDRDIDQTYVWQGVVKGVTDSHVLLVVKKDVLTGIIRLPDFTYKIRPMGRGLHLLRQIYPKPGRYAKSDGLLQRAASFTTEEEAVFLLTNEERLEHGLHAPGVERPIGQCRQEPFGGYGDPKLFFPYKQRRP